MNKQLLFLELNELNFDFVQKYVAQGRLPRFARLIARHGVELTSSEHRYEQLEPWIQWVTAHTGRTFAEHGVFRLGDIVSRDIPQIWELLEEQGLTVGAISPMNAKHRLRNPAFFVPDPWTPTRISARPTLRRLYAALSQAVNDNASSKISAESALALLFGAAVYARVANYPAYVDLAVRSINQSWRRAAFLDLLLADVFIGEVKRTRPNFASLFLNAAAHIQHHYMFSAKPYDGPHRNPAWYVSAGLDPVFEIYAIYDRIIAQIQGNFPDARLMLATGLHQVPHEHATYYWRPKDHVNLMSVIGVPFQSVEPRMSRDFFISCADEAEAGRAALLLRKTVHEDGTSLFEVDKRGKDLFVMLTYPSDVLPSARFAVDGRDCGILFDHVSFVALKNGEHDGIGYFLDTGASSGRSQETFPLKAVPDRIMAALEVRQASAG